MMTEEDYNEFLLLKDINPKLDKEYIHLRNFCKCEENDLPYGVALKHKKNNRIFCFQHYDFWRGRGEPTECKKKKCEFYCYVDNRLTKLTDYLNEDKGGE